METKFEHLSKVKEVKHPIGTIHHRSDDCLEVRTQGYRLILTRDMINLGWTIFRPNHDHDDLPHLVLRLPNEGKTVEFGERPELSLHLKGRYPRILHHGIDVYELDIITGEKETCVWRDGGWKTQSSIAKVRKDGNQ